MSTNRFSVRWIHLNFDLFSPIEGTSIIETHHKTFLTYDWSYKISAGHQDGFSRPHLPFEPFEFSYRAGPIMVAIIFIGGPNMTATGPNMDVIWVSKVTKYACNLKFKTDHISLQSWLQKGLNMFASCNIKWTCYACNLFQ